MKRRLKWYLKERIKRINFVKIELNQLVGKSMFKNTYNNSIYSITTRANHYFKNNKKYSISYFRFFCMFSLSTKLVNKKYRLSRFSMNKIAKISNIPGFIKRGW